MHPCNIYVLRWEGGNWLIGNVSNLLEHLETEGSPGALGASFPTARAAVPHIRRIFPSTG